MNTLHSELWEKVLEFEFENEICEYGFETRLADENQWSEKFAKKQCWNTKNLYFWQQFLNQWFLLPKLWILFGINI